MRYHRKIIRIRAEDSPNVRLALAQIARGEEPTGEEIVPGVKSWEKYQTDRKLRDKQWQTVALDAEFYKGALNYLFPQEVLLRCRKRATELKDKGRRAKALGVDSAEGNDYTVWTVIDEHGVMHQLSMRTEDTSDVPNRTIGLMSQYGIIAESVAFDRGGGGKQHADQLRSRGYDVRTIGFGESAKDPHKDRKTSTVKNPVKERVTVSETIYAYKNRRAELYGLASILCGSGFGIGGEYTELIRQLKVMPKYYDNEGRLYLPPKDKPNSNYQGETIRGMLGRSPDEADSFVLAVYAMLRKPAKVMVGAV